MIKVLLSSTIEDMVEDRAAVTDMLNMLSGFQVIGASPAALGGLAANSITATRELAEQADLYLLLLGRRYGYVAPGTQISATEREFDAAISIDPTKVLVYRRSTAEHEERQQLFVDRVRDYQKGYWTVDYVTAVELANRARADVLRWLDNRVALSAQLDIYDQFIRYALTQKPIKDATIEYLKQVTEVIFHYTIFGTIYTVSFTRREIAINFWGCIATLIAHFERWKQEGYVSS